MRDLSCSECQELVPDVALGVAGAEERANVFAHVESCRTCRDELRTLGDVADLLCELAPPVEPPPGFTPRVVASISAARRPESRAPSSRRRYLRPLSVAAALVLAAALGTGGWLATRGSGPSTGPETASLVARHHAVGTVMTVPGRRPWISVSVHLAGTSVVRCEVEDGKGGWRTVGTFHLYDGWGYWAAPLPPGLLVRRAELLTASGRVAASTRSLVRT